MRHSHGWVLAALAVGLATPGARADEPRFVITADSTVFWLEDGEAVKRYVGSVVARYDTLLITAQQADYREATGLAHFTGRARATDGRRTVWADTLIMMPNDDRAEARGAVRAQEGQRALLADTLIAAEGGDRVEARGGVRAWEEHRRVSAQGVRYSDRTGELALWGGVEFADSLGGHRLRSRAARGVPRARTGTAMGNVHFERTASPGRSALRASGDTLEVRGERWVELRRGVTIEHPPIRASAERAHYDKGEGRVTMSGGPRVRHSYDSDDASYANDLSGEQVTAILEDEIVTALEALGEALGVAHERSLAEGALRSEHEIHGGRIRLEMADETPVHLLAVGNATSDFRPRPGARDYGPNAASGDTLEVEFTDGTVDRITIRSGVRGTYFPPERAP